MPGYEVMVRSRDGEHLDTGLSGEIGIRGPGLFSAYYSPWVLREAIARDGWFMTGDIGRLDEMGGLHLMGRKKSVIFVGGLKFFPDEVEACINQLPGIEESRVFGRAHPRLGEVPCAEIVARSPQFDLDALRAHCSRLLSPWKVPIEFTQVAALPKTAGGKILRWRPDEGRAPAARAAEAWTILATAPVGTIRDERGARGEASGSVSPARRHRRGRPRGRHSRPPARAAGRSRHDVR